MKERGGPRIERGTITALLLEWAAGDEGSLDELVARLISELEVMARRHLRRERSGHTLNTSALVNEAFLRLIQRGQVEWQDRFHFMAVASLAMRRILVDYSRRHGAVKRGGEAVVLFLDAVGEIPLPESPNLEALDEALKRLETVDPEGSRLVELRFFGGFRREEIAQVLAVSPATVDRRWRALRAWLHSYLVEGERHVF